MSPALETVTGKYPLPPAYARVVSFYDVVVCLDARDFRLHQLAGGLVRAPSG